MCDHGSKIRLLPVGLLQQHRVALNLRFRLLALGDVPDEGGVACFSSALLGAEGKLQGKLAPVSSQSGQFNRLSRQ